MDEAEFDHLVAQTRTLAQEVERLQRERRYPEVVDALERWLAIDRTIIASSPHNLANLTVTLYRLGQACVAAGLPFARIRYTAEGVLVAARAETEGLAAKIPLDTLVSEFVACSMTFDAPFGVWLRDGEKGRVREAMTDREFGMLPETMTSCLEVARLFTEQDAPNWAMYGYNAVMVMGEAVYDSGTVHTTPLCDVQLNLAAIKAGEGMRPDATHLLTRAVGIAHNACLDGGVPEWRLLTAVLEKCVPILRTLGMTDAADQANDAYVYSDGLDLLGDDPARATAMLEVLSDTRRLLELLD